MAASNEAGAIGQGGKNQEYGGDIPAFIAHQGVPDRRLVLAEAEG